MRDLFDQDRPMTLGAIKLATGVLGLLFFILGIAAVINGLGAMIDGNVWRGLVSIVASLTGLFFMFLLVRLAGENIAAMHRLNDRMMVLGDDFRSQRSVPPPAPIAEPHKEKVDS